MLPWFWVMPSCCKLRPWSYWSGLCWSGCEMGEWIITSSAQWWLSVTLAFAMPRLLTSAPIVVTDVATDAIDVFRSATSGLKSRTLARNWEYCAERWLAAEAVVGACWLARDCAKRWLAAEAKVGACWLARDCAERWLAAEAKVSACWLEVLPTINCVMNITPITILQIYSNIQKFQKHRKFLKNIVLCEVKNTQSKMFI